MEHPLIIPTFILNDAIVSMGNGKIYGINTATQDILKAYAKYASPQEIRFRSQDIVQDHMMESIITAHSPSVRLKKVQSSNDVSQCAMYLQLPNADHFWLRQWNSPQSYSLCGLNHSLSGQHIYDHLRNIFLAPTEPWDALICTSKAAHKVINRYMENWSSYLLSRSETASQSIKPALQLPIIPLGTEADLWTSPHKKNKLRLALRSRLKIKKNDIVILFLGRLNFTSKAHPFPMLQALQKVQSNTATQIHLIQVGWYPSHEMQQITEQLAHELAPDILIHNISAKDDPLSAASEEDRLSAYAASDIFMSLSDNIQEAFGLTLIEAMACGLPVIASDWDGYRDTVVHGETGFLIPTLIAPPSSGADIALAHGIGTRNYNRYLADVLQATAVDLFSTIDALTQLIANTDLRSRMGQAGQKRCETYYDWRVIIKAYQSLWTELEERRYKGTTTSFKNNPHHPDPFTLFQEFASAPLKPSDLLTLTDQWLIHFKIATQSPTMRMPEDWLMNTDEQMILLQSLHKKSILSAAQLLDNIKGTREQCVRTVLWLIKANIIKVIS